MHIPFLPLFILGDGRVCDPKEFSVCALPATSEFYSKHIEEKTCGKCPTPCNQLIYRPSISSAFISKFLIQNLMRSPGRPQDPEWYEDNVSQLNIFFSELTYTEITAKEAYTVLSLFCDIGGAMGLVLGSTFLTVVEFFDFIARNVRCCR